MSSFDVTRGFKARIYILRNSRFLDTHGMISNLLLNFFEINETVFKTEKSPGACRPVSSSEHLESRRCIEVNQYINT